MSRSLLSSSPGLIGLAKTINPLNMSRNRMHQVAAIPALHMFCLDEPRDARDTISCVPRPHTHSEVSAMMTLRPRLTRTLRSFIRSLRGPPATRAQKIKFSLCVTESPPRLLSLFCLSRSLRELWRRLRDSFTKLKCRLGGGRGRVAQSASRPTPLSFVPLYEMSSERLASFSPDDGRNFRYRSLLQEGERKEMLNGWPSKNSLPCNKNTPSCMNVGDGRQVLQKCSLSLLACCKVFPLTDRDRHQNCTPSPGRERTCVNSRLPCKCPCPRPPCSALERIEAKFETVVITKVRSLTSSFPSAQVMTFVFRDQAPD